MGVSTDGMLYYGFTLDEDEEWFEDDEDLDWEDIACERLGGPNPPDVPYEGNEKVHSQFWNKKHAFIESLAVRMGYHCSCEYSMYFVYINTSYTRAARGYPEDLGKTLPVAEDTWDAAIKDFCEKMGIEYKEPHWELASLWC